MVRHEFRKTSLQLLLILQIDSKTCEGSKLSPTVLLGWMQKLLRGTTRLRGEMIGWAVFSALPNHVRRRNEKTAVLYSHLPLVNNVSAQETSAHFLVHFPIYGTKWGVQKNWGAASYALLRPNHSNPSSTDLADRLNTSRRRLSFPGANLYGEF